MKSPYNKDMRYFGLILSFTVMVGMGVFPPFAVGQPQPDQPVQIPTTPASATPGQSPATITSQASGGTTTVGQTVSADAAPADPRQMETRFVQFKPNFPLMPGSLDLYGYEREKTVRSWPVLSPDRGQMVMSEVIFMPDNYQTTSRVLLFPVGRRPALADILPPKRLAELEAEKQKQQAQNPSYTPEVKLAEVDPHAFWDRYQPEKQMVHRQIVVQSGFSSIEKYRTDIFQVADWSADGNRILMVYRPGIHHFGVYKTLPVIHNFTTNETVRYSLLPQLVQDDFLKRFPELRKPENRPWDIRVLGWSSEASDSVVVKLVLFEGQSEQSAGYWRYDTRNGTLAYLGDIIAADCIARHGWLATFVDPTATGEPKTYAPGQALPEKSQQPAAKPGWRSRLSFWKKRR